MRNTRSNSFFNNSKSRLIKRKSFITHIWYALKEMNEAKWAIALTSSLVSILILYRYLWIIGHSELLIKSIYYPSGLAVWMFFCLLCALLIILVFLSPAIVFSVFIALIFPGKDSDLKRVKFVGKFKFIVLIGFALLFISLSLSLIHLDLPASHFSTFIFFLDMFLVIFFAKYGHFSDRPEFFMYERRKSFCWNKKWREYLYFLIIAAGAAIITLLGVFPAELTLYAWRGKESGWMTFGTTIFCFLITSMTIAPAVIFYESKGCVKKKIINTLCCIGFFIFFTIWLEPAVTDIWIFSAANFTKVRNATHFSYVFSKDDYPEEVFSNVEWGVHQLKLSPSLYSIQAFSQFNFGDIQLLCPAKYSNVSLKNIDSYSGQCITISTLKIKIILPYSGGDK